MKIGKVSAENFGSYRTLEFNFSDLGLTLIHGQTGGGKSTLMDAVCWGLYGQTSKNGNADEVRSWQTEQPTIVTVEIDDIKVTRTRGTSKQNDLHWEEAGENLRGKDLTETQKLLEQRLGVSAELYLTGAYFTDFSPTTHFFSSKSKTQREVFENVAKLEFPVRLSERASDERKKSKAELAAAERGRAESGGRLQILKSSLEGVVLSSSTWDEEHQAEMQEIERKSLSFEEDKQTQVEKIRADLNRFNQTGEQISRQVDTIRKKVSELSQETCGVCGSKKESTLKYQYQVELSALMQKQTAIKDLERQLASVKSSVNVYKDQLESEIYRVNPFVKQEDDTKHKVYYEEAKLKLRDQHVSDLQSKISALSQIYDMSFQLRGELLQKSISEIEYKTNAYLEKYFDAELKVQFTLEGSDSLEVKIHKSGYEATFRQLSKGQRRLLTLCFSLSVMQAASDRAGVHFDCVMLDEPTDGMDAELKVKAFGLLEELEKEHRSVLVIEHNTEMKQMFGKAYEVTLNGDYSEIHE